MTWEEVLQVAREKLARVVLPAGWSWDVELKSSTFWYDGSVRNNVHAILVKDGKRYYYKDTSEIPVNEPERALWVVQLWDKLGDSQNLYDKIKYLESGEVVIRTAEQVITVQTPPERNVETELRTTVLQSLNEQKNVAEAIKLVAPSIGVEVTKVEEKEDIKPSPLPPIVDNPAPIPIVDREELNISPSVLSLFPDGLRVGRYELYFKYPALFKSVLPVGVHNKFFYPLGKKCYLIATSFNNGHYIATVEVFQNPIPFVAIAAAILAVLGIAGVVLILEDVKEIVDTPAVQAGISSFAFLLIVAAVALIPLIPKLFKKLAST